VKQGKVTAHDWATQFGVAETWMEEWAGTCPAELNDQGEVWLEPVRREKDVFSYSVSATPFCTGSLGVTIGGAPEWFTRDPNGDVVEHRYASRPKVSAPSKADRIELEPDDDWKRFEKEQLAMFQDALAKYRKANEIAVPNDLDKKLQAAAVYLFGRSSPANIRLHSGAEHDPSTKFRWVKEALTLLDLPPRRPGRPAEALKKSCTENPKSSE